MPTLYYLWNNHPHARTYPDNAPRESILDDARRVGLNPLDIGPNSANEHARALSTQDLQLPLPNSPFWASVDQFFHATKAFTRGGPFISLLDPGVESWQAASDSRLRDSGELIGFVPFDTLINCSE